MMFRYFLGIILFWGFVAVYGQVITYSGQVVDAETGESIPFATITGKGFGTVADLDGRFKLTLPPGVDSLKFSSLGYTMLKLAVNQLPEVVRLIPQAVDLETVTILPGINPADRLIKLAIANRQKNDPQNLPSFSYISYNKLKVEPPTVQPLRIPDVPLRRDSLPFDLLLWETVTFRKFLKPAYTKETVLASRLSGAKDYVALFSPTEFQTLSFYQDRIRIFDQNLRSPLSENALDKFTFILEETFLEDSDTIFQITFKPKPSVLAAVEGTLWLSSNQYAIKTIEGKFTPPENSTIGGSIRISRLTFRQDHRRIYEVWFPNQLHTDVTFTNPTTDKDIHFLLSVRSYLRDIMPYAPLTKRDFDEIVLEALPDAAQQSEPFWLEHRYDSLTAREWLTYRVIDSLGKKANLTIIFNQLPKLLRGKVGIGPLDLDLLRLYTYNIEEGNRFGFGLATNEHFDRRVNLSGWLGYGIGDERFKYGGRIDIYPGKTERVRLSMLFDADLKVTGASYPENDIFNPVYRRNDLYFSSRLLYARFLDYTKTIALKASFFSLPGVTHYVSLQQQAVESAFNYEYLKQRQRFLFSDILISNRWQARTRYIQHGLWTSETSNSWPVVELQLGFGVRGPGGSIFNYRKVNLTIGQQLANHPLGQLTWTISGGLIKGQVPIHRLYIFQGNGEPSIIFEPNAFNTMPITFFIADSYVVGFWSWQLPNPGFPSKNFAPRLAFQSAVGVGRLNQNNRDHLFFEYGVPEKGYFESGVMLTNLVPPYLTRQAAALRLIGIGIYRGFGPYLSAKTFQAGWILKLGMAFPF